MGIVKTISSPVPKAERGGHEQKNDNGPENIPESEGPGRGYGKKEIDNVEGQKDQTGEGRSAGEAELPGISAGQSQTQDDDGPNSDSKAD